MIMQIYADKVFKKPVETIEIFEPENVESALDRIETLKNEGLYLIGYIRYDIKNVSKEAPLVYFEAFESFETFKQKNPNYKIGTIVKPLISKKEYIKQIEYIKEQIKEGVTYEVNYTYPSVLKTNANEIDLYNYITHFCKISTKQYCHFLRSCFLL